jgi:hypothetical protein
MTAVRSMGVNAGYLSLEHLTGMGAFPLDMMSTGAGKIITNKC